jgi:hypothetical protein
MSRGRIVSSLLLVSALVMPLGCASSDSSASSAKSSGSSADSSGSSSRSSSPAEGKAAYRDELRTYTAGYAKAGGQVDDAYQKELGEIARRYAISNWEDSDTTFRAVGEGLGQSGAGSSQLAAYIDKLARGDADKRRAMLEGYNSRKHP